jgi:flagellar biosynthesis GTPase FlhF
VDIVHLCFFFVMATSNINIKVNTSREDHKAKVDRNTKEAHVPLSVPQRLQLEPISRKDNPPIYQLHISEVSQDDTFTRCAVGSRSLKLDPLTMASERVLMLVGATGTGKTTMINGIANYIFGTKWEDDFRLTDSQRKPFVSSIRSN